MNRSDKHTVRGWVAVFLSTAITSFWAYWGIIENFHEGWYYESFLSNIALMIVQYLSPMLIFMLVTLISISWPRFGGGLQVFFALMAIWFFNAFSNAAMFLIILPLIGIGLLYWNSHLDPKKMAVSVSVGLPLLTLVIAGIGPVTRLSHRINDGNLNARLVHGNGVDLIWAPDGPGWPRKGGDWYKAGRTCHYLNEDGLSITTTPQNIWRLPTVDEAVRSMSRHGQNSGGVWDAGTGTAIYETTPDKETPLWNIHSQVIYWWTATELDREHAYIIAYDGKVWSRDKQFGPAYLGFRCIKEP